MLQLRSTIPLDQIEAVLRSAAHRHSANVTVVSHLGHPNPQDANAEREAFVFTLYHSKLHTALLAADIRFAGFLPCRVAAWTEAGGVTLQALMPSEYCGILGRPELEPQAVPLDDLLRRILEDVAKPVAASGKTVPNVGPSQWKATEDQVNMRAVLPQRIDYRGTKIEDEGGTGEHDAPGG
jgi:hypothetical protein